MKMRKLMTAAAGALLAAMLVGCTSVEVCAEGPNMVTVQNSACYLFCFIPLFSGDPNYPNQQVCNWFEDTTKLETNMRLLDETAEARGATGYRNLVSRIEDERVFMFLLKRKVLHTSAELIQY